MTKKLYSFLFFCILFFTYSTWAMWDNPEEGWRRRNNLTIQYTPPSSSSMEFNFNSVHKSMAEREEKIFNSLSSADRKSNGALFGISVIVQDAITGEWKVFTSEPPLLSSGEEGEGSSSSYTDIVQPKLIAQDFKKRIFSFLTRDNTDEKTDLLPKGSTDEETAPLSLYFMSGESSSTQARQHPNFPESLTLETREDVLIVQARSKKPLFMQREIEEEFLNGIEDSFLRFSQSHKNIQDDHTNLKRLGDSCVDFERRAANVAHNPSDVALLGTHFKEITDALERLNPYNDSERLILRYFNYELVQEELWNDLKEIIDEGAKIHVILFHLHSRLDPCDRCAAFLFRSFEKENRFIAHLKYLITSYQDGLRPLVSLMVSSRNPHQKRKQKFWGEDGKEDDTIHLETFTPFYPLLKLYNPDPMRDRLLITPENARRRRWETFMQENGGMLFNETIKSYFSITQTFHRENQRLKGKAEELKTLVNHSQQRVKQLEEIIARLQTENERLRASTTTIHPAVVGEEEASIPQQALPPQGPMSAVEASSSHVAGGEEELGLNLYD